MFLKNVSYDDFEVKRVIHMWHLKHNCDHLLSVGPFYTVSKFYMKRKFFHFIQINWLVAISGYICCDDL